jgi:hypothetical protein
MKINTIESYLKFLEYIQSLNNSQYNVLLAKHNVKLKGEGMEMRELFDKMDERP